MRSAHATLAASAPPPLVIAEMQNLVADDLSGLVALSGDQKRIAGCSAEIRP